MKIAEFRYKILGDLTALIKGHGVDAILVLNGEYDYSNKGELGFELERVELKPRVLIDLSSVTFMDASCVGELIRFQARRRARGLKMGSLIVQPGGLIQRLFDVAGLARVFNIAQSLEEVVPKNGTPVQVRYTCGPGRGRIHTY